jgi:glycosyltransferase involved in cell wall biosynthesis
MPAPVSGGQSDPVRVLAYADSAVFSGAEAVHCELVRGLARSDAFELRCLAPRSNGELTRCLGEAMGEAPGTVPAQRLAGAALDLHSPRRRAAVGRAVSANPFDVMLVNLPSAEYGPTPMLARRPAATKSVGFLHVPGSPAELGFRFGCLRERLARGPISRFDAVCVVADSAKRTFERLWAGPDVAVHVVHLPSPQVKPVAKEEARAKLGLPADVVVIGMAGRISFKQKGQDTFIHAAARLLRERPDLRFAIAGEGRDLPTLRRLVDELGLEARVSLLGQVVPIERFLCAVDAIAIPSRFEGLPLIALEALSLGVPGTAANIDGLSDVWPRPWQVEPGDSEALAVGLAAVMETPAEERARLIARGRQRVDANTSPDPASALESVILETANG